MIKAIETQYKGYRFRSRLEARWAVFFDMMGIEWEYEPEGFHFADIYYLPDFLIKTNPPCYVEIKPNSDKSVNSGNAICRKFAEESHTPIMLLIGLPSDLTGVYYEHEEDLVVRTFVKWSYIKGFSQASLQAKQSRFEHGENTWNHPTN